MFHRFFFLLFLLASISLSHAQIVDRLGSSKDDSPIIIEADGSVVCDEEAHKCVATGNAKAQKSTNTVYGDILTVYFSEEQDVTSMTADGHVLMETPTEKAYGEHAHYDVKLDRILMTGGNLKIMTPNETLTARDSIEYWHPQNKGIARGKAVATFPAKQEIIQADTLVAYFKPSSEKTEEGKGKTAIDRVEAEGHMLASSPKGVVTGDRGVYVSSTHMVEVFNNVKISQEGNVMEGGYARHNLKTNVAELYTHPPHVSQAGPLKRISGIIIPKDVKKLKKESPEAGENIPQKGKGGQIFPSSAKKEGIQPPQSE